MNRLANTSILIMLVISIFLFFENDVFLGTIVLFTSWFCWLLKRMENN